VDEEGLNGRVLRYQRSGKGLGQIVAELAPRIYHYPLSKRGFTEDDCGEYFLFVYPRLLRTLERFEDQGKPFEWYLNSVLRWQLKEYRRRRYRREESWGVAAQPGLWDRESLLACTPPTPHYPAAVEEQGLSLESIQKACGHGRRLSTAAGRRLLFWALKAPWRLTPADIHRLAEISGLPPASLEAAVQSVEQTILRKKERLHRLYVRRNRCYARCLHLQTRISRELEPERRQELQVCLEKARAGLHRSLDRLGATRLSPSNRDIALALQVPKGTVDSSLYWLRRRLAAVQEERSSA
jgi:DNA-directed RNA polymerase specialized sigma24 family protein